VKDDEFTKEEGVGLYKRRFPVQENDFKSKKGNASYTDPPLLLL